MVDKKQSDEPAQAPIVDSDFWGGVHGTTTLTNVRFYFSAVKVWIKGWIAKGDVGLGSADNTSDANKPISTAQADAIAAAIVSSNTASQPRTNVLTSISSHGTSSGYMVIVGDGTVLVRTFTAASPLTVSDGMGTTGHTEYGVDVAALKSALTLVKADVGLGNVDNTSDANKPVSTAQATADATKITGLSSVTDDLPAIWDGITGKLLKSKSYAAFKTLLALVKADVGLGNVDNTSDANKPVSTATQTALDLKASIAYADSLVVGLIDDRGNYSASGNTFPASGGSGTSGAILKGDIWVISVAGTLGGVAVNIGDQVRALTDTPGQTAGNWAITEANIGYTPVRGPSSVTDDLPAIWDGTGGSLIKSKSYAAFKTLLALVKADVGLGNVDNTSDATKNAASVALTNKDLSSGTNTFPTLNQNTTGSAAKLTTARNIDGQPFDGTGNITVIAPGAHAATSKATPVDADEVPLVDSAASNGLKKLTWANLKATIKTYIEGLTTLTLAGTLGLTRAYTAGPQIDFSGQASFTLVNNGTTILWSTASLGKILIAEFGAQGDVAEYLLGLGAVTLLATSSGFFVAPTSTPAAGHASIYISGTDVVLVNKLGVTITCRVVLSKLV